HHAGAGEPARSGALGVRDRAAGHRLHHHRHCGRGDGVLKAVLRPLDALGALVVDTLAHIGVVLLLLVSAAGWLVRGVFSRKVRLGRTAMITQMIRVGVRSVFIISLVSASVGLILSLQMAPPLEQ